MKYLFGDSEEFPLQRDFLELLENYIDTSVKTITSENTVFENKKDIMDRRRLKNSVLAEMDTFLSTVKNAISSAVSISKEQDKISKYAQKSKDFLVNFIEEGKKNFSEEIFKEIAQFEEEIDQADEQNRKRLESFLIQDPLPIIDKKYTITAAKKEYLSMVQNDCEGDITYAFTIASSELPFWKDLIKASDFLKGVQIPARMKKPLLKKELEPDIVNIDDYILSNLVFSGNELEVVFRKTSEIQAERFRLKMNFTDEFIVEVYHADYDGVEKNINGVPELQLVINTHRLHELGENILKQTTDLYQKKQRLEFLHFKGRDVLEDNLIFDLMQKIAEIFAPTVAEIKKHALSKEELSLKVENEIGERSEIYLKKSQIKEEFGAIEEKGDKLLTILDIE
jgi:hypothetical protein